MATRVRLLNRDWSAHPMFRTDRVNGRPVVEFRDSSHHLDIADFANRHLAGRRFNMFGRALTAAERQGVEAYLAEKYGIRNTPK